MTDEKIVELNLNEGQQKGLDTFFDFMLSDDKVLHLTGGGGVGKTTLLNAIMTEGMDRYEQACKMFGVDQTIFDIGLTATTNKAAAVLALATGKVAVTIHSYMSFRVKEDYDTGETTITASDKTEVKQNVLIIIDEASMIDEKLLRLLMKYTNKCKFFFVGDHCQMAPVFEKLSKIYEYDGNIINLTVPMRNAEQPALMDLCQQWRETVETGVFKPIEEVSGVIEYLTNDNMQPTIDKYFADTDVDARILCFTNHQVKSFNNYVRELRGLPPWFEVGERLIAASAYTKAGNGLSVEQEVIVTENNHKEVERNCLGHTFNVYQIRVKTLFGESFIVEIPSDMAAHRRLMKQFANQKKWTGYFNLKNLYPDLRAKDASTVYKAQGSTYDAVFIDLDDISTCTHADQVARMMYVAVSRPKSKIYLIGKLKAAYSGG